MPFAARMQSGGPETAEAVIARMQKTKDNAEFLATINQDAL